MSFYTTLVMMLMAFLASLTLYFQPSRERYLKYFPLFLFVCSITEMISDYLAFHNRSNLNMYNVFTICMICYYYLTIYWIIRSPKVKRVILYIIGLYPLIAALNIFLIQKDDFHTMTYSLGGLIVVALCIYYFFELFQTTNSLNLLRQPSFWICSGLLFYYSCTFPLYGVTNIIPLSIVRNLMFVFQLLDVLLYLSFTIAFLCRLRVRKSTS